jgi:nicotinamide phosphoribosyltransferase
MKYYGSKVCGYSVVATEHSVMTARGPEGEFQVVQEQFDRFPTGILSLVIDSYDWKRFVSEYIGTTLKDRVLSRKGTLVLRPDSGAPVTVMLELLGILEEKFGMTVNSKGYKVLPKQVRVLWGDGIDRNGIIQIMDALEKAGYSIENIACFGMGGGLLQKVNRDVQRFAFKSSEQCREENGVDVWHDIYKSP